MIRKGTLKSKFKNQLWNTKLKEMLKHEIKKKELCNLCLNGTLKS